MHVFLPPLLALLAQNGGVTKTCIGEGDVCADPSWCPARNCGAWNLRVDMGAAGDAVSACKSIRGAFLKKVNHASKEAYCVSGDTSVHGFRCFSGDAWVAELSEYVKSSDSFRESLDESLTLNATHCEKLQIEGVQGGTVFMAGRCCAGWAVPCHQLGCMSAFEPEGPGIFNSAVSIMLVICAIVHALSSVMCVAFPTKLLESYPSTEDMTPTDRELFKNVIGMLGAAHGGFAGVLLFGAFQDWLYGKVQIALVSLFWYAILGPVAEAMQHGTKPLSQSHYINEFIAVAQGECVGKPPKINYVVMCVCVLVAIGVSRARGHGRRERATLRGRQAGHRPRPARGERSGRTAHRPSGNAPPPRRCAPQVETMGEVFMIGLAQLGVGIILTIVVSIVPCAPKESEAREERRGTTGTELR